MFKLFPLPLAAVALLPSQVGGSLAWSAVFLVALTAPRHPVVGAEHVQRVPVLLPGPHRQPRGVAVEHVGRLADPAVRPGLAGDRRRLLRARCSPGSPLVGGLFWWKLRDADEDVQSVLRLARAAGAPPADLVVLLRAGHPGARVRAASAARQLVVAPRRIGHGGPGPRHPDRHDHAFTIVAAGSSRSRRSSRAPAVPRQPAPSCRQSCPVPRLHRWTRHRRDPRRPRRSSTTRRRSATSGRAGDRRTPSATGRGAASPPSRRSTGPSKWRPSGRSGDPVALGGARARRGTSWSARSMTGDRRGRRRRPRGRCG